MTFWEGKKAFVTGSEGFLGKVLCNELVRRGASVIRYDYAFGWKHDVTNFQDVHRAIALEKPQYVFHLAANSIVSSSQGNPLKAFEVNVGGVWNVLEACRLTAGIEGVVVSSSNHIYGPQPDGPTPESAPLNETGVYSTTKICADYIVRCFADVYGLPAVALRHTNAYGPSDIHDSHIVRGTILSLMKGETPVIRSDGTISKGYLYELDTVNAYILLAEKASEAAGKSFNASSDGNYTSIYLAGEICRLMKGSRIIEIKGQPTREANEDLDSSAIRALGWEPQVGLLEGLAITIEIMKESEKVTA